MTTMSEVHLAPAKPVAAAGPMRQMLAGGSWMFLATAVASLAGLMLLPLLSRLIAPVIWGQFAVFQLAAGLLALLLTGRYELALPILEPRDRALLVQALARWLILAGATGTAGAVLILWLTEVPPALRVAAISLVPAAALSGLIAVTSARLTAAQEFRRLALVEVAAGTLPIAVQVATLLAGAPASLSALCMASILGQALALALAGRPLAPRMMGTVGLRRVLRSQRVYPLAVMPTSMFALGRDRLLPLFAMAWLGSGPAGVAAMAQRLANAPAVIAATALRPVFYGTAAGLEGQGRRDLAWRMALLLGCSAAFVAGLVLGAPGVWIGWLLGPDWEAADGILRILLVPLPLRVVAGVLIRSYDLSGAQRVAAQLELAHFAAMGAGLAMAGLAGGGLWRLATAAAAVSSGVAAVQVILIFRALGSPSRGWWSVVAAAGALAGGALLAQLL